MLKLYNTLSKQIEEFKPLDDAEVRMYTCGPTVYNYAHIGNMRAFIAADLLYRTLNFEGYNVNWVMNITDIDDKTITGAIEKYGSDADTNDLYKFTQIYLDAFIEDLKAVTVQTDGIRFIRVTDKIAEIQKFITNLLDKGYAYKAEDGSTYFSIEKYQADFGDYGELVGQGFMEGKKVGARVSSDEYEKENLSDFALWKAHSEKDAQIFWDHPTLGKGRPGWHIECSVINFDAFDGKPVDIHTGGVDLLFPHHTNEIAQSQALLGAGNFVKHWFHSEHILIDGKKMSKSLHNFLTLKDIAADVTDPIALRYLFLQSHYKSQQNFTKDSLQGSASALDKLRGTFFPIDKPNPSPVFKQALEDDLNSAQALATAWEDKPNLAAYDEVLGLALERVTAVETPDEVKRLLEERQTARDSKNFAKSDELRDEIAKHGFEVLDTPDGQKIKKI